jgi:polygalacturonase
MCTLPPLPLPLYLQPLRQAGGSTGHLTFSRRLLTSYYGWGIDARRTFEDITVLHETAGIHIKSNRGRGGTIANITWRRVLLKDTRQCILVDIGTAGLNRTNASATPTVRDILFEDVHCAKGTTASYTLSGLPEAPVEAMSFVNVTMAADTVKGQAACEAVQCSCDQLTSPCPSCCKRHIT